MKIPARIYNAAAALFVSATLVACGGGSNLIGSVPQNAQNGQDGKPVRHKTSISLGLTQSTVTGTMIQPLSASSDGTSLTLSLYGTTLCGAQTGGNPCPGVNFTGTPPTWSSSSDAPLTVGAASLPSACTPPGTPPTPAPGFTAGCYIVAYEGGIGPYLISGPATVSGSTLNFAALTTPLTFSGGNVAYNFFLAYVTYVAPSPPPSTPAPPTPVPTATSYNTPLPPPPPTPTPKPTATPKPTGTPTPVPTLAPSAPPTTLPTNAPTACPSSSGWHDDAKRYDDGGDDGGCCSSEDDSRTRFDGHHHSNDGGDEGGCNTPTPQPTCSGSGSHDDASRYDVGGDGGCCSSDDGSRSRYDGHHHSGDGSCATPTPRPTARPTPSPSPKATATPCGRHDDARRNDHHHGGDCD